MIKIIKDGIKELRATCPFCYCEFTYEREDVHDGIVNCPCCGAIMDVKQHTKTQIRDNMVLGTPEYKELQKALEKQLEQSSYVECNKPKRPCETCSYWLKLKSGQIYVGDSPCQWCQYSGGLQVTCTYTGSSVNEVK